MPISIQCPSCGQKLKANERLAGKRLPCPKCKAEIFVPEQLIDEEAAAAALLLQDDAGGSEPDGDSPDSPTPSRSAPYQPAPAPQASYSPPPETTERSFAPLKSNEPPLWLRQLHWLLMLALVPLAFALLQKPEKADNIFDRLEESIEEAPLESQIKIAKAIRSAEKGNADLDDILDALPRERLIGAAFSRKTHWHWGMALASTVLFLGFCVLLSTGGVADPKHLLFVGLFTGTIGVCFLLLVQAIADWSQGRVMVGFSFVTIFFWIAKLIGLSYRVALDPDNGFFVSFIGFTAGVGLCEEVVKAVPVLFNQRRNPEQGWRTAFLWGLASGSGFGIAEGVMYSGDMYNGISGGGIYLVRFISCVALHALWTGCVAIAAQQKQDWLQKAEHWTDFIAPTIVYVAVPMVLHGLYDTLLKKDMNAVALLVALASFGYLAWQLNRLHGADVTAATEEMLRRYKMRRKAMR